MTSSSAVFAPVTLLALLVGCGSPEVRRVDIPPAPAERTAVTAPAAPTGEEDEEATRAFLELQMETAPQARDPEPEPQPAPEVRTVYVDTYQREASRYRQVGFPWNAAVGAGIGAIIGHQSDNRDEGALIGAGVGLLVDLFGGTGY